MVAYSSTLAWKIPWTEEPGGVTESDTAERLTHTHTHSSFKMTLVGVYTSLPLSGRKILCLNFTVPCTTCILCVLSCFSRVRLYATP